MVPHPGMEIGGQRCTSLPPNGEALFGGSAYKAALVGGVRTKEPISLLLLRGEGSCTPFPETSFWSERVRCRQFITRQISGSSMSFARY